MLNNKRIIVKERAKGGKGPADQGVSCERVILLGMLEMIPVKCHQCDCPNMN